MVIFRKLQNLSLQTLQRSRALVTQVLHIIRLQRNPLFTEEAGDECCQQDFLHLHWNPRLVTALMLRQAVNSKCMRKMSKVKKREKRKPQICINKSFRYQQV